MGKRRERGEEREERKERIGWVEGEDGRGRVGGEREEKMGGGRERMDWKK
jgi:hypothetical protein